MSDISEMNVGMRWYVAHTYSGYENKVKASLEKIIENRGLEQYFEEVKIPVEIVTEKKGDVEKETEVKIFPGYVLIKMVMTDESWHAVRNITGVTGFVGPGSRPTPLSNEDVEQMGIETTKKVEFKEGDAVVICGGAMEGFSGIVYGVSDDSKKVTVLIKRAGGRDMHVELDAYDVKLA